MCGGGTTDDVVDVEVDVDHSSSTADILVRTTIN